MCWFGVNDERGRNSGGTEKKLTLPPTAGHSSKGEFIESKGALSAADMTTEATLTKLMYLLGNLTDIDNVNKNFERNLAGEMSV